MSAAELFRRRCYKGDFPPAPVSFRQYVVKALNSDLGVIVDLTEKRFISLVDARDVEIIKRFSLKVRDGKADVRVEACDNRFHSWLPLSHVILAAHGIKISIKTSHVHHIGNCCDNRLSMLTLVKPYSNHQPAQHDSQEYMRGVFKQQGIDFDSALTKILREYL